MKKLTTISLFIFGVITTAILTAGLVFYQNNKSSNNDLNDNQVKNSINEAIPEGQSITLNMDEISKHNKQTDCWLLINGKVYNITSYFGSHPGGNAKMLATCGTDASLAYATKNPNATSSNGGSSHSSNALSMLSSYFIGNINQTIGQQKVVDTNTIVPSTENTEYEDEDEDEDWED